MKSTLVLLLCHLSLVLAALCQDVVEGRWTIESGASTGNMFKESSAINLRYISPKFQLTNEDHYWTEEEGKHPDKFKNARFIDKAERNLRSNQRVAASVLMVAGGWVEGLYTSLESVNANSGGGENTKIIYNDISVHCHAFEYVFQLLYQYKNNADCAKLLQELEPAKATLLTYGKAGLNSDTLPKLRETVTALRNKIIS